MRKLLSAAAAALALTVSAPAAGQATLQLVDGRLVGATGVNVGGTLYDVSFQDGTCAALFDGCDSPGDFAFDDALTAQAAGQALLDQVLTGDFDAFGYLTRGCESWGGCIIETPYALSGNVLLLEVYNQPGSQADTMGYWSAPITWNTTGWDFVTYARFTPSVAAVPEPMTWVMMLLGFGGIGLAMRRTGRPQPLNCRS